MQRTISHCLIIFILLVGWMPVLAANSENFISIADIHFDPFADCKRATYPCVILNKLRQADYQDWKKILEQYSSKKSATTGSDTNYVLLESALTEIQSVSQKTNPRFIFVLGDFLAHNFRDKYITYSKDHTEIGFQSFVKKTLQFMTQEIKTIFPEVTVYPVVGNNDSYTGNYHVVPNGKFLYDTANTWSVLIKDKMNQKKFLDTFPNAGYYSVTLPGHQNQTIILLNTVLFSTRYTDKNMRKAAQTELNWLHQQLMQAAEQHQSVLLAFHIPVGVDVYATLQNKLQSIKQFWRPQYSQQFEAELKQFSTTIIAILPAHIHMDTFQLISPRTLFDIPVVFTPSISPIFGNNPGFKVFSYHPENLRLIDYDTYFIPMTAEVSMTDWRKEYSFNEVYQAHCLNCDMTKGMQQLTANNYLADYYKKYYAVSNNAQPITKQKAWVPYYWCGIHAVQLKQYRNCLGEG